MTTITDPTLFARRLSRDAMHGWVVLRDDWTFSSNWRMCAWHLLVFRGHCVYTLPNRRIPIEHRRNKLQLLFYRDLSQHLWSDFIFFL